MFPPGGHKGAAASDVYKRQPLGSMGKIDKNTLTRFVVVFSPFWPKKRVFYGNAPVPFIHTVGISP